MFRRLALLLVLVLGLTSLVTTVAAQSNAREYTGFQVMNLALSSTSVTAVMRWLTFAALTVHTTIHRALRVASTVRRSSPRLARPSPARSTK